MQSNNKTEAGMFLNNKRRVVKISCNINPFGAACLLVTLIGYSSSQQFVFFCISIVNMQYNNSITSNDQPLYIFICSPLLASLFPVIKVDGSNQRKKKHLKTSFAAYMREKQNYTLHLVRYLPFTGNLKYNLRGWVYLNF